MNKDLIDSLSNLLNVNRDLAFYIVFLIAIIVIIVAVLFGKKIIAWLSKKDYVNNQSSLTHSPQNFGGQQVVSSQGTMQAEKQTITNNHNYGIQDTKQLEGKMDKAIALLEAQALAEKQANPEKALAEKEAVDKGVRDNLNAIHAFIQ
jgi:hypothetical protein